MSKLSRRVFLTGAGSLSFGFLFNLSGTKAQNPEHKKVVGTKKADNISNLTTEIKHNYAYIEISSNEDVTFLVPDVEFGQGIYTTAAILLAEELEVDINSVEVKTAYPNAKYIIGNETTEITWGSGSTQKDWLPMQQAAAALKMMFIQAASQQWNIRPDQCHAKSGKVYGLNDLQLTYGSLLQKVSKLPVPKDVALKSKDAYQLIGKSQKRIDTLDKIHGTAQFGADVKLPSDKQSLAKTGLILTCPVLGGKLAKLNDDKARKLTGVITILREYNAVCIVADHFWTATQAAKLLDIEWDFGENASINTKNIYKSLTHAADENAFVGYMNSDEKIEVSLSKASHVHKATYKQPILAHAALEPINCTVAFYENKCEIWSCSQTPLLTQERVAQLLNKDKNSVIFNNVYVGGSFGRRLDDDYILLAVKFAKRVQFPLRCMWSREEDFAQDTLRPPYLDQVEAGVDHEGVIIAIKHQIIGPSVTERWNKAFLTKEGMDPDLLLGIEELPYQALKYQLNYTSCEVPAVKTGWWQGNGATRNIFVIESLINKCAEKVKKDPIEYRKLLKADARATAVMDLVALQAQWDKPTPKGVGRGFALAHVFGSYIAMVIEAEITAMSIVRFHRVVVALDCGLAVNPDQIAAQIESGVVIGLGSAMYNEVQIEKGQIVQRNFNQYRVLRMNETPQTEVHIVKSDAPPSGVGELGTIVAAPALAQALGILLNKSLYALPLNKYLT